MLFCFLRNWHWLQVLRVLWECSWSQHIFQSMADYMTMKDRLQMFSANWHNDLQVICQELRVILAGMDIGIVDVVISVHPHYIICFLKYLSRIARHSSFEIGKPFLSENKSATSCVLSKKVIGSSSLWFNESIKSRVHNVFLSPDNEVIPCRVRFKSTPSILVFPSGAHSTWLTACMTTLQTICLVKLHLSQSHVYNMHVLKHRDTSPKCLLSTDARPPSSWSLNEIWTKKAIASHLWNWRILV